MQRSLAIMVWCLAASLSCLWTQDWADTPWVIIGRDGSQTVGLTWRGRGPEAATCSVSLDAHALTPELIGLESGGVLRARLPANAQGTVQVRVGSRVWEKAVAPMPQTGTPAAAIILDRGQILDAAMEQRIGERYGDAPVVVVMCGGDRPGRLQRGEAGHRWPIVALGQGADDAVWQRYAADAQHPTLIRWGALGLSAGSMQADWASMLARDLSAWSIPILTDAVWDPALFGDRSRNGPEPLAEMIGLLGGLGHPLVLQLGSRVGFISEPMSLAGGGLTIRSGGVRIVGATPLGEPIAGIDGNLTTVIERSGVMVVHAQVERLELCGMLPDGELPLVYVRAERPSAGWGGGDVQAAWKRYLDDAQTDVADLAWSLGDNYAILTIASAQREALILAADTPILQLVAKRVLAHAQQIADEPEWLTHERILREIGGRWVRPGSPAWQAIAGGEDIHVVHAAIRCADGRARPIILEALTERLQRQVRGEVAFASDPLDQHRLVSAVFDAPDMSPTPLRALARDLAERLDPLSRGPIDRFIAAHGRYRTLESP